MCGRCETLEIENETLRAELKMLRREFEDRVYDPPEWRLPRMESRVLAILTKRERISKDTLAMLLFGADAEQSPTQVESHVSKLNTKLRAYGIRIQSARHRGYWLDPEDRARIASGERLQVVRRAG